MEVTFASDNCEELHSMYYWLRSDLDVARAADIVAQSGDDRADMGSVDTVMAVFSGVTGFASLSLAFDTWWRSRATKGQITITRTDGHQLTITGTSDVSEEMISRFLTDGTGNGKRRRSGR